VVKRLFAAIDGLGSPSVTWVLDELVVGDDIFDWVTPRRMGARSAHCSEAVGPKTAGEQRANWSFQPRTLMCCWDDPGRSTSSTWEVLTQGMA
jgi:hypothetical protein